MTSRPRILLADDHRMVAEGLKALLAPAFELVGVVEDGAALLQAAGRDPQRAVDPVTAMTPRQREVLRLFAEGRTAKEIGSELGISARTVETHKYELMRSLGVKTSAELVHFAIRHGIVEI